MSNPQDKTEHLDGLINAMEKTPILVIGDIMLDKFVYGSVERISPESPVPILSVSREDSMLGGAGNALSNLAGLNAAPYALSIIGNDEQGAQVKDLAQALNIDISGLITDKNRPTTIKTRYLSGHQQMLRTDFEKKGAIDDSIAKDVIAKAEKIIPKVKAVILSDYGKGMLRPDVIAAIIATATSHKVPVIVDPKQRDFSVYKGASVVTPNKKELSEATQGKPVSSDNEIEIAAKQILETCGINAVIATRSADGMSVIQNNEKPMHLRSADIEVFDVSGAGDTVIATIAATLAAGGSLQDAASLANLAGSIVVTKVGTAPIRAQELTEALHSDIGDVLIHHYAKSKTILRQAECLSWDEAAEQIKRWKARGLKTGFTNGCFDVLHAGHVNYLNQAREHCDRLIVGVNSDSSVRILKGPERPVHDEAARADVLGALSSVDMVVLFGAKKQGDDNTAIALLETLKPDIYFKGGDYTVDQIPEAPTVQAYGGKVSVMSVYEGHSTTGSIAKIKAGAKSAA